MANDIKVGDLVMVTKSMQCCGRSSYMGKVFIARSIELMTGWCPDCFTETTALCVDYNGGYLTTGFPMYRLIKIDPPALPEEITKDEEITA